MYIICNRGRYISNSTVGALKLEPAFLFIFGSLQRTWKEELFYDPQICDWKSFHDSSLDENVFMFLSGGASYMSKAG